MGNTGRLRQETQGLPATVGKLTLLILVAPCLLWFSDYLGAWVVAPYAKIMTTFLRMAVLYALVYYAIHFAEHTSSSVISRGIGMLLTVRPFNPVVRLSISLLAVLGAAMGAWGLTALIEPNAMMYALLQVDGSSPGSPVRVLAMYLVICLLLGVAGAMLRRLVQELSIVAHIELSRTDGKGREVRVPCIDRHLNSTGIIVLSDLHICSTAEMPLIENNTLCVADERLQSLVDAVLASRVQTVVLCGDVTDSGSAEEWARSRQYLDQLRDAGVAMILVPGNHDICVADKSNYPLRLQRPDAKGMRKPTAFSLSYEAVGTTVIPNGPHRRRRYWRYLVSTVELAVGDVFAWHEGALRPAGLYDVRQGVSQAKASADAGIDAQIAEFEKLSGRSVEDTFPLLFLGATTGPVIVLDTCGPSLLLPTNAFGRVHWTELLRLRCLLVHLREEYPLLDVVTIAIHHHLRMPRRVSEQLKDAAYSAFSTFDGADAVLGVLARFGGRYLVLHGHHHVPECYTFAVGSAKLLVVGSASSTLGDQAPTNSDSFASYIHLGEGVFSTVDGHNGSVARVRVTGGAAGVGVQ